MKKDSDLKKDLRGMEHKKEKFLSFTEKDKRLLIGKSIIVVFVLDYFFYQSLWALIPLSWIGVIYYRMEKKLLYQKKKEQTKEQFKELMLLVSTGQKAGYSVENAFLSSYDDMKTLYGKDSSICRMLCVLKTGRENNVSFTSLWRQIGQQLSIAEISEFADVYEISHKCSGNVAAVMEKTAFIIIQKMETDKEIRVLLSARRLEQKIMNVMPFLIMLYISITSPGYFKGLYHTIQGILVMSLCLGIYLGAYTLSVRMISIEI